MRRTNVVGLCLALVCACGLIGAASASAALPELGRCVKVTAGSGGYNRSNCIAKSKTHTGEFEWMPGPGANAKFEEKWSNPQFETTTGARIVCSFAFLNGEFTGTKGEKIIPPVTLQGCGMVGPKFQCYTNTLEPGTIESETPLVGDLGDIPGSTNPANPWLGWDLKPESGSTLVMFQCGEAKVPQYIVSFSGSMIGRVRVTNKMQPTFLLNYKQEKGIQKPEAFIGGSPDTLTQETTSIVNPSEKKVEQVGLAAIGEITPAEPLELKAK